MPPDLRPLPHFSSGSCLIPGWLCGPSCECVVCCTSDCPVVQLSLGPSQIFLCWGKTYPWHGLSQRLACMKDQNTVGKTQNLQIYTWGYQCGAGRTDQGSDRPLFKVKHITRQKLNLKPDQSYFSTNLCYPQLCFSTWRSPRFGWGPEEPMRGQQGSWPTWRATDGSCCLKLEQENKNWELLFRLNVSSIKSK